MSKKIRYRKLPGSHKQRNRARHLLKCDYAGNGFWHVWGGEATHSVAEFSDGSLRCGCDVFAKSGICSHVIKVQMEKGLFPTPIISKVGAK